MASASDAARYVGPTSIFAFTDWRSFDVTDLPAVLDPPGRAIRVAGAAGTITVKVADGTPRAMMFSDGETRSIICTEITSIDEGEIDVIEVAT